MSTEQLAGSSLKPMTAAVPGLRILACERRAPADAIAALRHVPTPNISDSLGRVSPAGLGLRPLHDGARMIGPALTVRVPPGDNLLIYKAIAMAQPGDVLVIDAGGARDQAVVGEIMTTWAAQRGLAGMVVHGAARDVDVLAAQPFPVYACGVTHRGPYRDGPGEINVTVSLGGMLAAPGDLVVGDASGVVVVPFDDLPHVMREAVAIQEREDRMVSQIRAGEYDPGWIDIALRARGYAV